MKTRIKEIVSDGVVKYRPQKKATLKDFLIELKDCGWSGLAFLIPIIGQFGFLFFLLVELLTYRDFITYKMNLGYNLFSYIKYPISCEYSDIELAKKDIDDYLKGEFKNYYKEAKEIRKKKVNYIKYP